MVRLKGDNGGVALFKEQNYHRIKRTALQLASQNGANNLFRDPAFPAIDAVLGSNIHLPENIVWKRPKEICAGARLFADVERCQAAIGGGELSTYWMVSACSILSNLPEIRNRIIPDYWEQECIGDDGKYCGVFHFRFWRFGRWLDVVVDDLLPTVNNALVTTHTENGNEFWTALLEKAYAKLHGSYEALREYSVSDALVDFTGGVTEILRLDDGRYSDATHQESRGQLLETLTRELAQHTIVTASVHASTPSDIGARTELGICRGHVYQVTDIKRVYLAETNLRNLFKGREKVAMLRLKDPRIMGEIVPGSPISCAPGEKYAYSTSTLSRLRSRNSDWQKVKDLERHRIGLDFADDHEFWMPVEDVLAEFTELALCRSVNENVFTVSDRRAWSVSAHTAGWEPAAGTSPGNDVQSKAFFDNPQFLFRADAPMELMVQLMQFGMDDGFRSPSDHRINHVIGFHIIKVEENRRTRVKRLWGHYTVVVEEGHGRRSREVVYRGRLTRGTYVVVPSTLDTHDRAMFLIRLFTRRRRKAILKELTADTPNKLGALSCIGCLGDDIEWITVIVVNSVETPDHRPTSSSPPPHRLTRLNGVYCKLVCEGRSERTDVARNDQQQQQQQQQVTWNTAYIFYRKAPHKPINVQLYRRNAILPDELVCECELAACVNHTLGPLVARLCRPVARAAQPPTSPTSSAGCDDADRPTSVAALLHLTVLTEDNTMAI